ncbi:MAG: hypothetical protein GBAus27B_000446 [Mycoplasmataceae bacterium]|nr:MAG: hypothetical protein GBAus27B_000446 [Mycoplasmataceae bacterium]
MNYQQIQELTRRYLQSLDLPSSLDRIQKAKIIEINSQSEWLIFNASSLSAKRLITSGYDFYLWTDQRGFLFQYDGSLSSVHIESFISSKWRELGLKSNYHQLEKEVDRWKVMGTLVGQDKMTHLSYIIDEIDQGFSPETHDINSPSLQNLLLEVIKDQYAGDNLEAKVINFNYGSGKDENKKTISALSVNNKGRGSENQWIAIKKIAITSFGYDEENIFLNPDHWRKSASIDGLLNEMKNNHPKTSGNTQASTSNNLPSRESNEIALIIGAVEKICAENKSFIQKGRQLGINLKEINPEEIDKFCRLIDSIANNEEVRKIFDYVCEIYNENLLELTMRTSQQDGNNLTRLKTEFIEFIKNYLKHSGIKLENDDWETQINNSTNSDQIQKIRNQILATINIHQEEKINESELISLIEKGKNYQDINELVEIISKIENFHGEKIYELHLNEIQEIKNKLFNQESSFYSTNVYQIIVKEMENKKAVEGELSDEIKSSLNKIKNQVIKDKREVDEVWKNILDEINQIIADKEITDFLRKYQQSTNSEEKEKNRQKIQVFVIKSAKNKFLNFAYQKQKIIVDKILGETVSNQTLNDVKKDKWLVVTPIIITCLILVSLLTVALIIKKKKR